jgi:hypothetical protein
MKFEIYNYLGNRIGATRVIFSEGRKKVREKVAEFYGEREPK